MKKIILLAVTMLAVSAFFAPTASAQAFQLPTISVSPASWDFGPVPVFAVASKKFVVSNTGDLPLVVTAVKTKAPFSDGARSFTVAPHSSRVIQVLFLPTAQTTYSSVCTILSNAANAPVFNIPLAGQGI